jgi:hypothetical protein
MTPAPIAAPAMALYHANYFGKIRNAATHP